MLLIHVYSNLIGAAAERNSKPKFHYSLPHRNRRKGYEIHHIIPRSLGGSDHPYNLVYLTPREHYTAHHILARIYGGKLAFAFWIMTNSRKTTARQYQTAHSIIREAASKAMKGVKKKPFSAEHCKKLALVNKGRKMSEETRLKHIERMNNIPFRVCPHCGTRGRGGGMDLAHFDNCHILRGTYREKDTVICPHCNKTGQYRSLRITHFDNCKHKP